MKVVCSKENLEKSLKTVRSAVPSRTTLDILKTVLLETEENTLKITANDTTLGIETQFDALVMESGSIAVDAGQMIGIVQKLPDTDIVIETGYNYEISIRAEETKYQIPGTDPNQFISLPVISSDGEVVVSQYTVKEMIEKVIFSIADNNLNAAMNGVYLEVINDHIRMTTLDGHIISIRVNELRSDYGRKAAIIPGKTLNDLSKILVGDREKEMSILFSVNHIVFRFDETTVISRIIDGDYFKIDSMLRGEHETVVRINKNEFYKRIDRSTPMIYESDKKPIILDIKDGEMNLRLKSQLGMWRDSIEIEKTGSDLKIAFNPRFLMDALRVIDDEEITIKFVRYNFPCTIEDENNTYKYVILPVNFTEE